MEIFGVHDAAEYLGVSVPSIKHYVYVAHTLKGEVLGRSLIFTKVELDEFKKHKRSRGRPRKGQECQPRMDKKYLAYRARSSNRYNVWRQSVIDRDKHICQICGCDDENSLHAHHILSFMEYPKHRFDVDNGITVCDSCHVKIGKQDKVTLKKLGALLEEKV